MKIILKACLNLNRCKVEHASKTMNATICLCVFGFHFYYFYIYKAVFFPNKKQEHESTQNKSLPKMSCFCTYTLYFGKIILQSYMYVSKSSLSNQLNMYNFIIVILMSVHFLFWSILNCRSLLFIFLLCFCIHTKQKFVVWLFV